MPLITGAFVRIRSSWTTGSTILGSELSSFDQRAAQVINADQGGVWAPTNALVFTQTAPGAFNVTGPVVISNGGQLQLNGGALCTLFAGSGPVPYPLLGPTHAGRSRSLVTSFLKATSVPLVAGRPVFELGGYAVMANAVSYTTLFPLLWNYGGTTRNFPTHSAPSPIVTSLQLDTHHGGTLASVTLRYRNVLGAPKARVVRIDSTGTTTPLASAALGADANGWLQAPAPDTTKAVQTWTITLDGGTAAANAVIDRGNYTYAIDVQESQAKVSATAMLFPYVLIIGPDVNYASNGENINLASPGSATVDGFSPAAGQYVLLKDQLIQTQNGIYVVPSPATNAWTNLYRFDTQVLGVPVGWTVRASAGAQNMNSYWQYQGSSAITPGQMGSTPNTWGTTPDNPIANATGGFVPQGNVYLTAVANHTNITSLAFQ